MIGDWRFWAGAAFTPRTTVPVSNTHAGAFGLGMPPANRQSTIGILQFLYLRKGASGTHPVLPDIGPHCQGENRALVASTGL